MYSRTRRFAAVLAAAALGVAPALAAGAAQAAPANPSVEFSGGSVLNMLVCRSEPSAGKLTVPADSRVTFVNRLGQNGTLRIDGKTVTSVGANQAVPVVFHHGPVNVSLTISCQAGVVEEFKTVTVAVTPKAAAPAKPATPSTAAASGGGSTTSRGSGSSRSTPSAAATGTATADPWAPSTGLPASTAPANAPVTGDASPGPAGTAAPAADVGDVVAASGEPVHGPSGLLAMIATVLTIGVGVAAVRSVWAARATRLRFA